MLEIAGSFERTAAGLSPPLLIALGLACVTAGLFVWLGGLGFRKLLVALVGAIGGGICGFLITGQKVIPVVVSAGIGAFVAVILKEIFITIFTAALAAACGFAVLADLHKANLSAGLRQACSQMPLYTWAIIAALAVGFILAGVYFWRFTSALCCATFGALLVFAGMILLLLHKGAAPASSICSRPSFYSAVFIAMTAFGTFEQLLLCRPPRRQPKAKKETGKDKGTSEEKPPSWRSY
jgi:hypothetical protein